MMEFRIIPRILNRTFVLHFLAIITSFQSADASATYRHPFNAQFFSISDLTQRYQSLENSPNTILSISAGPIHVLDYSSYGRTATTIERNPRASPTDSL